MVSTSFVWLPATRFPVRIGVNPKRGLIGTTVYARDDTPLHSLLHEACHLIAIEPERRDTIHTDASTSQTEEDAACYLQIVLGGAIPGVGRERIQSDMDTWGYTFRLGSARAWFERDAGRCPHLAHRPRFAARRLRIAAPRFSLRTSKQERPLCNVG